MKKFGLLLIPVLILVVAIFSVVWPQTAVSNPEDAEENTAAPKLPVVGDADNLRRLLAEATPQLATAGGLRMGAGLNKAEASQNIKAAPAAGAAPAPVAPNSMEGMAGGTVDYSGTNLQVTGVDEADIVKTDGQYIYQVTSGKEYQPLIVISKAYPAADMAVVSTLKFDRNKMSLREMYVDDRYLVVVADAFQDQLQLGTGDLSPAGGKAMVAPELAPVPGGFAPARPAIWPMRYSTTKILVYDLKNKANPQQVRELELDGNYVSSRKVGTAVYVVSTKSIDVYRILNGSAPETPAFQDSVQGDKPVTLKLDQINYFPQFSDPNYLLVGGFDLAEHDQPLQVQSYLGAGQNIYASPDNLYVAVTQSSYTPQPMSAAGSGSTGSGVAESGITTAGSGIAAPATAIPAAGGTVPAPTKPALGAPAQILPVPPSVVPPSAQMNTSVYKFALQQGRLEYRAHGEVPGSLLNQFSMDEFAGNLRLATTKGDIWRTDAYTSQNNVYVLGSDLTVQGRLEGLAPGERIYAARFMGKRAYLVTFRTVDPLFVVDLQDPAHPEVLGELKIPGYSDYLQPYDENHLIGMGKEAVEVPGPGGFTGGGSGMAYYLGMKLAMFDVTDVEHPVEMYTETIGDRGTDSEALHNHKALLFAKDKNLLAFPVRLAEVKSQTKQFPGQPAGGPPPYGELTFQGAFVYQVDLDHGFTLKGRISHQSSDPYAKLRPEWFNSGSIERILYIGDSLYTVSKDMIKANDLSTLQEQNSLVIFPH